MTYTGIAAATKQATNNFRVMAMVYGKSFHFSGATCETNRATTVLGLKHRGIGAVLDAVIKPSIVIGVPFKIGFTPNPARPAVRGRIFVARRRDRSNSTRPALTLLPVMAGAVIAKIIERFNRFATGTILGALGRFPARMRDVARSGILHLALPAIARQTVASFDRHVKTADRLFFVALRTGFAGDRHRGLLGYGSNIKHVNFVFVNRG